MQGRDLEELNSATGGRGWGYCLPGVRVGAICGNSSWLRSLGLPGSQRSCWVRWTWARCQRASIPSQSAPPHPGLTQGPNGRRPLCPEQCHAGKVGLCDLARLVWRPLRSLQRPCQGSLPLGSKPGLSPVLVPTLVWCERTGRSFPPSRPPLPHLRWRRWSPRSTVETIHCWRRIKVC